MELKQLAESITMIGHKKKLEGGRQHKFKNRPLLWEERISRSKDDSKGAGYNPTATSKKGQIGKKDHMIDSQWKVPLDHIYSLRFDSSISNLRKSIWVDGVTINYFNA